VPAEAPPASASIDAAAVNMLNVLMIASFPVVVEMRRFSLDSLHL